MGSEIVLVDPHRAVPTASLAPEGTTVTLSAIPLMARFFLRSARLRASGSTATPRSKLPLFSA